MKLKRIKLFDILLNLIMISMYFTNADYFLIPLGNFSIRLYMIFIIASSFLFIVYRKEIFVKKLYGFVLILFFGLLPFVFSQQELVFSKLIGSAILMLFQILTFLVLNNMFIYQNREKVLVILKKSLIIIEFSSFILFLLQISHTYGARNEIFLGVFYGHNSIPRMIGFMKDPNYFGLYITSHLFLYIYLKDKLTKKDYILIAFSEICVFLTQSRAGILANVIGILLLVLLSVKGTKRRIKAIFFICLFSIASIILTLIVFPQYSLSTKERLTTTTDGSITERVELLKLGISNISKHPFGIGLGNVQAYYEEEYGISKLPHNDFISVFIECGIFGLIFYITYFYTAFCRSSNKGKVLIIVLFIYLNFLSCYNYEAIVPIVFGLIFAEIRQKKLCNV